ncbi:DUF3310 domain-containing protein [Staphylococcus epidermidis]|uniref:DUF3310 domain-containing protein n=1 Tax=Staphylococcus epidermidis TaxID=1282 RepID=UPI003DA30C0F
MKNCAFCKYRTIGPESEPCAGCDAAQYFEEDDAVEHPEHYTYGKYECIDVMTEVLGADEVADFCICNAFKYLFRCQHKHETPIEDVKKAVWYLNKYLSINE